MRYIQSFITMMLGWHLWLVYNGRDLVSDVIALIHIIQTLFTMLCVIIDVAWCQGIALYCSSSSRVVICRHSMDLFSSPCDLFTIFIFKFTLTDFLFQTSPDSNNSNLMVYVILSCFHFVLGCNKFVSCSYSTNYISHLLPFTDMSRCGLVFGA